jgi:hypothetical protein
LRINPGDTRDILGLNPGEQPADSITGACIIKM